MKKILVWTMVAIASWYSTEACQYNPDVACPTASGRSLYELESKEPYFAAAYGYPFGTKLVVTNVSTGKRVEVRVYDRGPNKRLGRALDLSRKAFQQIADPKKGLIEVKIEVA